MHRNVLGKFALLLGVAALGLGLATTSAHALSVTPADVDWNTVGTVQNSNCNAACVQTLTGISGLTLLYKSDVGTALAPLSVESGTLAGSYSTVFSNAAFDPADFTITYDGGAFASCPQCILLVKDGNHTPYQYLFNLGDGSPYLWNGTATITGTGFWPASGAISNVAIWGTGTSVPEPASLMLLGAGLAGIGIWRRKSAKS